MTTLTITIDLKSPGCGLTLQSEEGITPPQMVFWAVTSLLQTGVEMHDGQMCQCILDAISDAQKAMLDKMGIQASAIPKHSMN